MSGNWGAETVGCTGVVAEVPRTRQLHFCAAQTGVDGFVENSVYYSMVDGIDIASRNESGKTRFLVLMVPSDSGLAPVSTKATSNVFSGTTGIHFDIGTGTVWRRESGPGIVAESGVEVSKDQTQEPALSLATATEVIEFDPITEGLPVPTHVVCKDVFSNLSYPIDKIIVAFFESSAGYLLLKSTNACVSLQSTVLKVLASKYPKCALAAVAGDLGVPRCPAYSRERPVITSVFSSSEAWRDAVSVATSGEKLLWSSFARVTVRIPDKLSSSDEANTKDKWTKKNSHIVVDFFQHDSSTVVAKIWSKVSEDFAVVMLADRWPKCLWNYSLVRCWDDEEKLDICFPKNTKQPDSSWDFRMPDVYELGQTEAFLTVRISANAGEKVSKLSVDLSEILDEEGARLVVVTYKIRRQGGSARTDPLSGSGKWCRLCIKPYAILENEDWAATKDLSTIVQTHNFSDDAQSFVLTIRKAELSMWRGVKIGHHPNALETILLAEGRIEQLKRSIARDLAPALKRSEILRLPIHLMAVSPYEATFALYDPPPRQTYESMASQSFLANGDGDKAMFDHGEMNNVETKSARTPSDEEQKVQDVCEAVHGEVFGGGPHRRESEPAMMMSWREDSDNTLTASAKVYIRPRAYSVSMVDDFPVKGILKHRSVFRSVSECQDCCDDEESSAGPIGSSELRSVDSASTFDGCGTPTKKTVRFSERVQQNVFRPGSSILGQRKKNQRKTRNRRKRLASSESCDSQNEAEMTMAESLRNSSPPPHRVVFGIDGDLAENSSDSDEPTPRPVRQPAAEPRQSPPPTTLSPPTPPRMVSSRFAVSPVPEGEPSLSPQDSNAAPALDAPAVMPGAAPGEGSPKRVSKRRSRRRVRLVSTDDKENNAAESPDLSHPLLIEIDSGLPRSSGDDEEGNIADGELSTSVDCSPEALHDGELSPPLRPGSNPDLDPEPDELLTPTMADLQEGRAAETGADDGDQLSPVGRAARDRFSSTGSSGCSGCDQSNSIDSGFESSTPTSRNPPVQVVEGTA